MRGNIVAELASNHGGDLDLACEMIRVCAEAGADVVKVQSYTTNRLSPHDPQYAWLKQAELSDAAHERLLRCCARHHIGFLTTAFHEDRLPFLARFGLDTIKIGSGEAMKRTMIDALAQYPWHVYLSTGLATAAELDYAVKRLGPRLTLLHCVSEYPTPPGAVNLPRLYWLRERYGVPVGYSDHTVGVDACQAALVMQAPIVEKHFSMAPARTQPFGLGPSSLEALCRFRDAVALMQMSHPMDRDARNRPYVGRWAYGA